MSDSIVRVKVNKNEFTWDKENGLFSFDGAPALLFWDTAIELFIETIMEVSGPDVSTTVFEATGFRMGKLVSSYYKDKFDIEEVFTQYSDIYRNAGWGNIEVAYFSLEEKKIIVRLKNSWEHRIFKLLDKDQASVLLPSHWAGVFSSLLEENMWYKLTKNQLAGDEYDEVEIFLSTITPNQNIHALTRQKEQKYIQELEEQVDNRTKELTSLVKTLSTPVLPVLQGVLVIPLVGKFNDERMEDLMQKALFEFTKQRANYLLLDLTAINGFDEYVVDRLQKLVKAVELVGGKCILVGISASFSLQIIQSGVNLKDIPSFSTLEQGVEFALEQTGFELIKAK
ncbi:STAS domain-containing protein [Niallia nealsonii]|uniref:Fis family transcriptional regulator n=1 Tax=Niallia nealsonii TaxID=115979 RepID=A0A2N0Z0B5_9BACI|nr:STAS domain-containing protein [Niallia nealsonii]PKG22957.1 Fis family transcriptional regulator [Niallia nealsonii]